MGENSAFESRRDSTTSEQPPSTSDKTAELRRSVGVDPSQGKISRQPARTGMRRERLELIEGEEHIDRGLLEDWRSFIKSGFRAAALCAGCVAFFMSAALMLVAYTAAHCFCAGKDFTESLVGWYIFERSPYWARAVRGPIDVVIQTWAHSPRVLLYLCFSAALILGCLLVLETALAYRAHQASRKAARRLRIPPHNWFATGSIACMAKPNFGEPIDLDSCVERGRFVGVSSFQRECEARQRLGLASSGLGEKTRIEPARTELQKGSSDQTAAVIVPAGAHQLEGGGILHFVAGLFRSILPGSLLRGLFYIVRRRAADRQAGFTPPARDGPSEEAAEQAADEAPHPVMTGSSRVSHLTRPSGLLNSREAALAPSGPPSTCSDPTPPSSSSSEQEASGSDTRVDEGEDDWCFVTSQHANPAELSR